MSHSPVRPERPPHRTLYHLLMLFSMALVIVAFGLALSSTSLAETSDAGEVASSGVDPVPTHAAGSPGVTIRSGSLLALVPHFPDPPLEWTSTLATSLVEADSVWPSLGEPVLSGSTLWLDRSVPFSIVSAGRRQLVHGHGYTVGEGLASAGIYLVGRDVSFPGADAPLEPHMTVAVDRIWEEVEIIQETTSFETVWQADPEIELDQTRMLHDGQVGILLRRYKVTYVNGERQEGRLEDRWIQQEPQDRVMAYGTKVVLRPVDTPSGSQQYWRRVRVLVTSYSPSTAGVSRSSPHYGLTRTGKKAGTGMIAVDPSVIPFGTRIYVPGYGIGVAEDTGSAIIGRHIDVCYDDADLVSWRKWVDVYLLAPAPGDSAIRWVLPNWPRER